MAAVQALSLSTGQSGIGPAQRGEPQHGATHAHANAHTAMRDAQGRGP